MRARRVQRLEPIVSRPQFEASGERRRAWYRSPSSSGRAVRDRSPPVQEKPRARPAAVSWNVYLSKRSSNTTRPNREGAGFPSRIGTAPAPANAARRYERRTKNSAKSKTSVSSVAGDPCVTNAKPATSALERITYAKWVSGSDPSILLVARDGRRVVCSVQEAAVPRECTPFRSARRHRRAHLCSRRNRSVLPSRDLDVRPADSVRKERFGSGVAGAWRSAVRVLSWDGTGSAGERRRATRPGGERRERNASQIELRETCSRLEGA
jgi:hypothetical protein